jgi:phosphoribosylformylglycinamidine synthase
MVTRLEIATRPGLPDSRGVAVARKIRSFLGISVADVRTCDVYRIDADLEPDEAERVLAELVDPVLQIGAIDRLDHGAFDVLVDVAYKPGVTDPVGKSARVAIEDTLGRRLPERAAVYTSRLYLLFGATLEDARRISSELLANPLIQTAAVRAREEWCASAPDSSVPRVEVHMFAAALPVDLPADDSALVALSRERLLALNLAEMRAIRDHFVSAAAHDPGRGRAELDHRPTDVELECLAQTWSEHCKHKIFQATIAHHDDRARPETIRSLFSTYIRKATSEIDLAARERDGRSWLVSVFHDNAGVVAFDDAMHLVYKVETHNSPSALDPYGGAITGIVGVNRDPFGTGIGADLLVNVWGYCFADPAWDRELPRGLLHPRRVRDGVHEGVIDGGNQSGIPYGRGWERFDGRFLGKPLVFCGTVGTLPVLVAGRPGERKHARPGDRIVMTGGRIGADGIHGATFSSAALDESAPVQAVQIGDPITQKRMFDFLLEARDQGLYAAITDNGAGGLSSSIGEMAREPGGARVDLARAPLKYPGLAPWEILVSEAQERMTLAVPPEHVERFLDLARRREVEATVIGEFTDDGLFHVTYGPRTVGRLAMAFLHDGAPPLELVARWAPRSFAEPPPESRVRDDQLGAALLGLLSRRNVAVDETLHRRYDHEVKGLTVIKPFVGVDRDVPADATVFLARHGSLRGFALAEGVNPFFSDLDTHAMAWSVVDEALRKLVAIGADPERIAILDNFCWPDPIEAPENPEGAHKLGQLVRACRGLYEAALAYEAPLVSGKDSMKNDSTMGGVRISVPPTLLISALGQIDDVRRAVTLELDAPGDLVYVLGQTRDERGASEYSRWLGERDGLVPALGEPQPYIGGAVPRVDPKETVPLYRAVAQAHRSALLRSATTTSLGGLAVAWARTVMASGVGVDLDLEQAEDLSGLAGDAALFSESNGRFVVTIRPQDRPRFEDLFHGHAFRQIGTVTSVARLVVRRGGRVLLELERQALREAFHAGFGDA